MRIPTEHEVIDVDFAPKDADIEPAMRVKRRSYSECQHTRTLVDEVLRRVTCRDCEIVLDPVEVLLVLATDKERRVGHVKALRQEQERREKAIASLKVEERNAKARLKNARLSLDAIRQEFGQ